MRGGFRCIITSLLWSCGMKTFPVHRPEAELDPTGGAGPRGDARGGGKLTGVGGGGGGRKLGDFPPSFV